VTSGKDQNTRAPDVRNKNDSANPSDLAYTGRIQKNSVEPSGVLASNPIIQDAISKNGHFTSDSNTEQLSKTVMDSNKKSSNPTAPLASKVSAGNPSSSQRGGGSTPTKTGGGAAPIQGASSSASGGGSKPNGSSNSNSKPIIGKNGRPINTGSVPAVKAVPSPVAHI